MKQKYAIATSMMMLALILIGAQTHALFLSGNANGTARMPALKTSIVETLTNLNNHHQHDEPPSPFDRGVPNITIH